jgi:Mg-chelatase subunit ChlD
MSAPKLNHESNMRKFFQSKVAENRMEKPINAEKIPIGTEVKIAASSGQFFFDKIHNSPAVLNSKPEGTKLKGGIKAGSKTEEDKSGGISEPRSGRGGMDESDVDAQIGSAMSSIAGQIVAEDNTGIIDIIFLLDISGSMENNIQAVGNHLSDMADMFVEKGLDFTLGIVKFRYVKFLVFPQTKDIGKYQRLLKNVKCGGDERAYDAIVKAIGMVKFRQGAKRQFIIVTDEKMKGSYSILEVIKRCQKAQIKLDVIGIDDIMDKYLARQTGGIWYLIPGG